MKRHRNIGNPKLHAAIWLLGNETARREEFRMDVVAQFHSEQREHNPIKETTRPSIVRSTQRHHRMMGEELSRELNP